jgi:hypothetical protein
MSLDGLRAWIGEVERKLGMRTRVFLVLVAIAIGGAGAGIYLALKAADDSVSKSEVQALRERVETASGEVSPSAEPAIVAALKAEVETLRSQVEELEREGSGSGGKAEPSGHGSKGTSESSGGAGESAPSGGAGAGKLRELVEKAKEHAK